MGKILEIKNATKRFGGLVANEAVTFDVEEGEIVGVVGPNGAGKTTLFNSISGAHTLTEGNVFFKGKDADVIAQAFKEFVKVNEKKQQRPSLRQKLKGLQKIIAQNKNKERSREKNKDRGQSL